VKKVHFAKGQTHIIEDTYVGQLGYDSSGYNSFTYVLRTGASWKNPIGSIRVICDVSGLNHANLNFIDLKPARRVGNNVEWYFSNLRPTHDIYLYWKPVKKAKR